MDQVYEVTIWTNNRNSKFTRAFVCSRFQAMARCLSWYHQRMDMKPNAIDWIEVKKLH